LYVFFCVPREKIVSEIPARALVEMAPVYLRESSEPAYLRETRAFQISEIPEPTDYQEILLTLLGSPTIACKRWVYEQYDHMVMTNTLLLPGSDSALLRIKGTNKALALTIDGNGRYCYLDPYEGGKAAVAEAARNLVCTGAVPLGMTNCLNFGNPTKPEIFWQFKKCVEGMAEACKKLEIPVTGGNVSFYNESPKGAIYPTPIVGMVGLLEKVQGGENDPPEPVTAWFKEKGDLIIILGETYEELGGSEYLKVIHGVEKGLPPILNLDQESALQKACLEAIAQGIVESAHDCSEGGLLIALAESCLLHPQGIVGAHIVLDSPLRKDTLLFGESQSRMICSLKKENLQRFQDIAQQWGVPLSILGEVREEELVITTAHGEIVIHLPIEALITVWRDAIERHLTEIS